MKVFRWLAYLLWCMGIAYVAIEVFNLPPKEFAMLVIMLSIGFIICPTASH